MVVGFYDVHVEIRALSEVSNVTVCTCLENRYQLILLLMKTAFYLHCCYRCWT